MVNTKKLKVRKYKSRPQIVAVRKQSLLAWRKTTKIKDLLPNRLIMNY